MISTVSVATSAFANETGARQRLAPPHGRPAAGSPVTPEPMVGSPSPDSIPLLRSSTLAVPAGIRVLIIAPHPDDETLAAGGLIQRVQAHGGSVHVVFVTNGDGYVDGLRRRVNRSATSSRDFVEYGRQRHVEALQALERLGVATATQATFLGFPDDGIDDLWGPYWSNQHPYTSPHTHLMAPDDRGAKARGIAYAGMDLENELQRILTELQPDWLVIPDPRDRHPDHCTTGVFVLDGLRRLRQRHPSTHPRRVLTYLVHAPDYPASPSWFRELAGVGVGGSSTAHASLDRAAWFNLTLSDAESRGKQAALARYESQAQVMLPFLQQFLRGYELFAEMDVQQIETVAHEYAARFGRSR